MKIELEKITEYIKSALTGLQDAEAEYGYDMANELYDVEKALEMLIALLEEVKA